MGRKVFYFNDLALGLRPFIALITPGIPWQKVADLGRAVATTVENGGLVDITRRGVFPSAILYTFKLILPFIKVLSSV